MGFECGFEMDSRARRRAESGESAGGMIDGAGGKRVVERERELLR